MPMPESEQPSRSVVTNPFLHAAAHLGLCTWSLMALSAVHACKTYSPAHTDDALIEKLGASVDHHWQQAFGLKK